MNFNSASFALFIALVGVIYYCLQFGHRGRVWQNLMLLGASYYFYGSWDHRFLFLILISTSLDYVCGLGIEHLRPSKRVVLALAVTLGCSALVLCAPIDWPAVRGALLPTDAFAGGWAQPVPFTGVFKPDGSWLHAVGAAAAVLLVGTVLFVGFQLPRGVQRRYFLVTSMAGNLTLLGFFKYYDFFVDSAADFLSSLGLGGYDWRIGIVVPVGISFYTFQTMSYTIDIYRGQLRPTRNILDFALFVSFFPQLVAGPIERASVLLPQFQRRRTLDWSMVQAGAYLVGWGLFKKIFIADNLADLVRPIYEGGGDLNGPAVVLATYAFAFQIYCDFSGYSDIARGISRFMGVDLMVNFNVPYVASNPRDFWRRWHISLSTWLRDYLYIPLGGNYGGAGRTYVNLMLTMILGGLWHGARANFLWWGIYQGALLCGFRMLGPLVAAMAPRREVWRRLFVVLCWFTFFHMMCYGWLLFRAQGNEQIGLLTGALFTGWGDLGSSLGVAARIVWFIWLLVAVQVAQVRSGNLLVPMTWWWPVRLTFYVAIFYLTVIFGAFDVVEFIYFQF